MEQNKIKYYKLHKKLDENIEETTKTRTILDLEKQLSDSDPYE